MSVEDEYAKNYKEVRPTKTAVRQGNESGLSKRAKLKIIRQLKLLIYWPQISEHFEHEKVDGAIEFKFKEEDKWIRVFAYQDDERKIMWVIKVLAKKSNKLLKPDLKGLKIAVSRMEQDIKIHKKELLKNPNGLKIVKGRPKDD